MKQRQIERLKELFEECAQINRWKIEELNIQPDHVHILMRLRPSISVSKAVQLFKGGSSKVIRKEFPELQEFLWGDNFWSEGYFVESVGIVDMATIKKYIQDQ